MNRSELVVKFLFLIVGCVVGERIDGVFFLNEMFWY